MTKLASIQPNDIIRRVPSRPRSALTQEQVFRLLRCAIKDDEQLVDEMIEQVYQDIIGFDYKRAEFVIEQIVRRSATAHWAFRSLLQDMRRVGPQSVLLSSPYSRRNRRLTAMDRF
jgi:hypothetical protein